MPKDPATAYGPSQERRTRTPISFEPLPETLEGSYQTPVPLDLLRNPGAGLAVLKSGLIKVDPNKTPNVGKTIRHEAIHQILMNQIGEQARPLAIDNPFYSKIANIILQTRGGRMADEVPAYMGAFDKEVTPVPQDWRDTYIDKLKESLLKINPQIGKQFGALSK